MHVQVRFQEKENQKDPAVQSNQETLVVLMENIFRCRYYITLIKVNK